MSANVIIVISFGVRFTKRVYLKLIHCLQLLKIWNQSGPILQGLEKLHLELHHFWQVPKQYIQLQETNK